jgi:hypothetical protein
MTRRLHKVVAAAAASLVAATALVSLAATGAAAASAAPPWEPDKGSVGALVFYNHAGHVITSGSINSAPFATYVKGTAKIRSGDKKATLFAYLPKSGEAPGAWSGEALTASPAYPNKKAPGTLKTLSLPLVSLVKSDETLKTLIADYPQTKTGAYAGLYQLRVKTSGPGRSATTTYDSADIKVTGSKWALVYPKAATTKTKLTSSSASVKKGHWVRLKASLTPSAAAGTVTFYNGSKVLGRVKVSKGVASLSIKTLGLGKHKLKATFVPTNAKAYKTSTSAVITVTVKA